MSRVPATPPAEAAPARPGAPGAAGARRAAARNVRKSDQSGRRQRKAAGLRRGAVAALVLTLCGATGWGAWATWDAMRERGFFLVRQIEITGTARLSEADVLARLDLPEKADLPGLDLNAVSDAVLSHPWVERATVRRVYPGTLAIRVWERIPAAVAEAGDKRLMLDADGVVLGPPEPDMDDLPRLAGIPIRGLSAGDRVRPERVRAGLLVANAYGRPSLVDVADLHDPLLLADGLRIRLGDRGGYDWRLKRLERLAPALEELAGQHGAEVDLRYADRVVARPL
ncbi:MAG: FtsQ-type POTRA domain-containing protein [Nitrospirae bacterium]|nr:FtsQ-type POTRA domain-containing protein [Nitrospirota bacterium]